MREENLSFFVKNCVNHYIIVFSMDEDAFESYLKKVEHLYSNIPISRTYAQINQIIMNGEMVFLDK